jgi:hypothetical protein
MQKMNLKSIYKLCKSCRPSRKEYNKICVAIFWFFCEFLRISQVAGKTHKRFKNLFVRRPLESFGCSQLCPWFAQNSSQRSQALQSGPRAWGTARPVKFRRPRQRARLGSGWGGARGCTGPVWELVRGEKATGGVHDGDRQRQPWGRVLRRACSLAWATSEYGSSSRP